MHNIGGGSKSMWELFSGAENIERGQKEAVLRGQNLGGGPKVCGSCSQGPRTCIILEGSKRKLFSGAKTLEGVQKYLGAVLSGAESYILCSKLKCTRQQPHLSP